MASGMILSDISLVKKCEKQTTPDAVCLEKLGSFYSLFGKSLILELPIKFKLKAVQAVQVHEWTREINETRRAVLDRFEQIQLTDARFTKRIRTVHGWNGSFRKTAHRNGNEDNTLRLRTMPKLHTEFGSPVLRYTSGTSPPGLAFIYSVANERWPGKGP